MRLYSLVALVSWLIIGQTKAKKIHNQQQRRKVAVATTPKQAKTAEPPPKTQEQEQAQAESKDAFRVSMGFIDVETSRESIQEDEDLIEAVEEFVGNTAHSVYKDIMNDIQSVIDKAHSATTSTFPFIVRWREDTSNMREDFRKIAIFAALFIFTFYFLAPSERRRKKRKSSFHQDDFASVQREEAMIVTEAGKKRSLFRRHSSSSPAMMALLSQKRRASKSGGQAAHEETPEESFAQRWPALSKSNYRRLVLPPECKRVKKPRNGKANEAKKEQKKRRRSTKLSAQEKELDEDHPVHRLRGYYNQCKHLVISFLKFDYMNFFYTLTHMFQACFKTRRPDPKIVDDYADDDESDVGSNKRGSVNSQSSTAASSSGSARISVSSITLKKRNSISGTPSKDQDSDADSVVSLASANSASSRRSIQKHPETIQTPTASSAKLLSNLDSRVLSMPTGNDTKVKDALQNYRTNSTRAPLPPLADSKEAQELLKGIAGSPNRVDVGAEHCRHSMATPGFFDSAESQEHLKKLFTDDPIEDENGYILGDEFLPESSCTPLLVIVNSRSGQRQGDLLLTQLRGLLNPVQIWDLANGGPEDVLDSFIVFSRLRVLVCGGDGTVSWVVGAIEKMNLAKWPPLAILPLGTGNDLARVHGWGGGYNNESLTGILEDVTNSYVSWLDRWEIIEETKKGKVKSVKAFLNYFGVGADAQAALQVHMLRESRPQLFFSRVVNKVWYALFGAEDIIKNSSVNLPHEITLVADGVEVPLPHDSQGIILLNIDSYAGGVPIWSTAIKEDEAVSSQPYSLGLKPSGNLRRRFRRSKSMDEIRGANRPRSNSMDRIDSKEDIASMALPEDEKFRRVTAADKPSSCQDGLLDIVSLRGTFHLGQIQVGLGHASKLCQCRSAEIRIKRKVPVQLDGEPWRQNVSVLKVKRKKDAAIMLHRTADDSNGVESEMSKLLDWAEDENLIDNKIHAALMKEFSRRIERKTRQKQGRPQETLMWSIKRAMASSDSDDNDVGRAMAF